MTIPLGNYSISLSDSFRKALSAFITTHQHKSEAGGILLGQVVNKTVHILHLSFPNSFDKASKYEFIRDKNAAQVIIDFQFYNSHNKTIYLGEWHTHPENNPSPSSQDQKMIDRQFRNNKLNEDFLILLIVGFKKAYIRLLTRKEYFEESIVLKEIIYD